MKTEREIKNKIENLRNKQVTALCKCRYALFDKLEYEIKSLEWVITENINKKMLLDMKELCNELDTSSAKTRILIDRFSIRRIREGKKVYFEASTKQLNTMKEYLKKESYHEHKRRNK